MALPIQDHLRTESGRARAASRHIRALADLAKEWRIVDDWVADADTMIFRVGQVTYRLEEAEAPTFLRSLLRQYEYAALLARQRKRRFSEHS